jgi:hypothetical protein
LRYPEAFVFKKVILFLGIAFHYCTDLNDGPAQPVAELTPGCITLNLVLQETFTEWLFHFDAPITLGAVSSVHRMIHRFFKGKIAELVMLGEALSQHAIQKIMINGIYF